MLFSLISFYYYNILIILFIIVIIVIIMLFSSISVASARTSGKRGSRTTEMDII